MENHKEIENKNFGKSTIINSKVSKSVSKEINLMFALNKNIPKSIIIKALKSEGTKFVKIKYTNNKDKTMHKISNLLFL